MRPKNKMLILELIMSLPVPKPMFPPSGSTNLLWIICVCLSVFPKQLKLTV